MRRQGENERAIGVRARIAALTLGSILLLLPGRGIADVVRLHNGDVLSGELVELAEGKVVVATDYAGRVSIDATFVAAIETDAPFTVDWRSGERSTGRLVATQAGLVLESGDGARQRVALDEVATIHVPEVATATEPPGWRWFAAANAGVEVRSRTEDELDVYLDGETLAELGPHSIDVEAELEREREDGELTDSTYVGGMLYRRRLGERWSALLFSRYERDRSEDLDHRFAVGPGLGYRLIDTPRDSLGVEAGPGYVVIDYRDVPAEHLPAARLSLTFTSLPFSKRLRLEHQDTLLTSLERTDRMVFQSETSARWRLGGPFTLGVKFQAQWANQAPPDIEERDIRFVLTLGYQGGDLSLKP